jgi:hypothetical protein
MPRAAGSWWVLVALYSVGFVAVTWFVQRPPWERAYDADRDLLGLILLIFWVPLTLVGFGLMVPYVRWPHPGWRIAYHVTLWFIVVLAFGVMVVLGFDFFLGETFWFWADNYMVADYCRRAHGVNRNGARRKRRQEVRQRRRADAC